MQKAIDLSREGMQTGQGGPFGCVIVKDGVIVGKGCNRVLTDNDPTAHAEITAIRNACQVLQTFELTDCTLYTSCEPCPMCMAAIYWARIPRIYFSNSKQDATAIGFDDSFIYDQVALPPSERAVFIRQIRIEDALEVFKEWENKEDKTTY